MEAEGAAGWDASAQAWIARVDSGDPAREYLLDPNVLDICGEVSGLAVLDVGCGEGRISRKLAEREADVSGLDPCQEFVATATRRHPEGHYIAASAEAIPFSAGLFDLVMCYLVLIDVPDHTARCL